MLLSHRQRVWLRAALAGLAVLAGVLIGTLGGRSPVATQLAAGCAMVALLCLLYGLLIPVLRVLAIATGVTVAAVAAVTADEWRADQPTSCGDPVCGTVADWIAVVMLVWLLVALAAGIYLIGRRLTSGRRGAIEARASVDSRSRDTWMEKALEGPP